VHLDGEEFTIWVKRYKSGRTRVLLPDGYEVAGFINNTSTHVRPTDGLTVELLPRKDKK
jgi:hypothetical protein